MMRTDVKAAGVRAAVAWALSGFVAGVVGVAGAAALIGWEPLRETLALWGLPSVAAIGVGAVLLGLAAALLVETAAFYAAFITAGLALAASGAWLSEDSALLALPPFALALLSAAVCVLRADEAERAVPAPKPAPVSAPPSSAEPAPT